MSHPYDLQSSWDHWNSDPIFSDIESAARAPRIPRDRPDRPGGGSGGVGGGGLSAPYLSGNPSVPDSYEYNVQITFRGNWPTALHDAVVAAANAISSFI
ncbi:MAG: hypothetical protein ACREMY_17850, partial [bacterium]